MSRILFMMAAVTLAVVVPLSTALANLPVIDGSNLSQNMVAAYQSVAQTLKQVQQYAQQVQAYQLQLQQYANMLQNTLSPATYLWQQARSTMASVRGVYETFSGNGLENYLNQFRDVNYWENLSPSQYPRQFAGSQTQKQANDALVRGIVQQQQLLQRDAANLDTLESGAQNARGQMQALQAANQMAGLEAEQLMQVRAILLQQQQALAARMEAEASKEAAMNAASQKALTWTFVKSSGQKWSP